jgi:hypothetical protein
VYGKTYDHADQKRTVTQIQADLSQTNPAYNIHPLTGERGPCDGVAKAISYAA